MKMNVNFKKNNAKPKCCVIGLGKLGLPLLAVLANAKFFVTGFDVNKEKIAKLNNRNYESNEPGVELLLRKNRKKIEFVDQIQNTSSCDLFFIIVPTPSDQSNRFSNDYVIKALTDLLHALEINGLGTKTIVIVSTVMPETCEKLIKPIFKDFNSKVSKVKVRLLYSPEFIALGSVVKNLCYPDMTLIGAATELDSQVFLQVMNKVVKNKAPIVLLSLTEAEIVKILVNCYVTMKISFANFISEIADSFGNLNEKLIASVLGLDSRIGSKYLIPGLGYGGPCFPRDNNALIAATAEKGLTAHLSIATDQINIRQPQFHIDKILRGRGNVKSVGLIGITYKPDSEVLDESQMIQIANILLRRGIELKFYDPLVKKLEFSNATIASVPTLNDLNECDLVISTSTFSDYLKLSEHSFQTEFISI